jgi:hypothetical protein
MSCRFALVSGYVKITLPDFYSGLGNPTIITGAFNCPSNPVPKQLMQVLACGNMDQWDYTPKGQNYFLAAIEKGRNPLLHHQAKAILDSTYGFGFPRFENTNPYPFVDWALEFLPNYKKTWIDSNVWNQRDPNSLDPWMWWESIKYPTSFDATLPTPIIARYDNPCGQYNQWFSKVKGYFSLSGWPTKPLDPNPPCEYIFVSGTPVFDPMYPYFNPNQDFAVCSAKFHPDLQKMDVFKNGIKYGEGTVEWKITECQNVQVGS